MEAPSNLVIAIVAEGLFLALVVTVVRLLITHRQLLKQQALQTSRDSEIGLLHQRLQQTHQNLHTANETIKQLQSAKQEQDDQLLLNYQKRITNLEKFKELYFELEARMAEAESISTEGKNTEEELEQYKQRARELEAVEARLQNELVAYRRRLEELEKRQTAAPNYGTVRLKEVEDLNSRLQQREGEIRRLRQECETIGQQYEELATKSLAMVGDGDDLSEDQKMQLEELKRKLEENTEALARKQAECELLENCYLELEESAELSQAAEQLQQSNAARDALQAQQREINSQVEKAVGHEAAEEMVKLRTALADKEASLNGIRDDYKDIKEQFLEIAQEQSELRKSNETLEQEAERLRQEVRELSETREQLIAQKKELEKLRTEYSTMESRYLALVDKYR